MSDSTSTVTVVKEAVQQKKEMIVNIPLKYLLAVAAGLLFGGGGSTILTGELATDHLTKEDVGTIIDNALSEHEKVQQLQMDSLERSIKQEIEYIKEDIKELKTERP